ncbi:NAD-dependent epimerase/dehydratase family protein [Agriterribacter sp.]|uniref:NAD-dependent epimerase/dehydratase family protein n=1 Tax=Agriterribacter sp. TaxID=2821509 RepID=UPI002CB1A932|nr:NAD-dependent epimerase/dehydratase family protein [Agriterribacter sp.]HRO45093.1 NAD-dependent epimerase/dehydratase family protein [Agriterribacter sp.]HRQ15466.1 NAD-dependent epimerase/dehydratase family protein [Agriterribacter sp.]
MITGDGFLARAFKEFHDSSEIHIFASGVSDSGNISQKEFGRERSLLEDVLEKKQGTLVYFSTCSIYDESLKGSLYINHKLLMEEVVRLSGNPYLIFRLSNPVGKTDNPHTLINFFVNRIESGKKFDLWKGSFRNILDIEDVVALCSYFISKNKYVNRIINVANPLNYSVGDIVCALEKVLNKKADYNLTIKKSIPQIKTTEVIQAADELQLRFDENYLNLVLAKYFGGR